MPSFAQDFKQTLLWGAAFAILGSLLGMTLGWLAPVYYQAVFSLREGFDPGPVTVGGCVGGMQGFIGGVIWYLVLAVARAWGERPRVPTPTPTGDDLPTRRQRTISGFPVFFLWLVGLLAALSLAAVVGMAVGFYWGVRTTQARHRNLQRGRLIEILRRGNHSQVTLQHTPQIALEGMVADQSALKQLRDELTTEFGQDAVNSILSQVRVATDPTAAESESP